MDTLGAIRELLEADGRFRVAQLGSFYLAPWDGPARGDEPVFGVKLVGRYSEEVEGADYSQAPAMLMVLQEDMVEKEDPEYVARHILGWAEIALDELFAD